MIQVVDQERADYNSVAAQKARERPRVRVTISAEYRPNIFGNRAASENFKVEQVERIRKANATDAQGRSAPPGRVEP